MADNDATVTVEDEAVVTVDVTDHPELAAAVDNEIEAAPAPKPAKERAAKASGAVDEAAAALIKTADDARIAALATAEAERQRANNAERIATQRATEAEGYRGQAEEQQLTILTNGIDSAKREVASAKQDWRNAQEAGDFDKAADAQERLAKGAAAVDRLEAAKAEFDAAPKKPTAEGRVEAAPVPQQVSAFERYVSGFPPQAQAWLRSHPECVPPQVGGNPTKNAAMMKGHYAALEQNIVEGSPDYFRVIEETTGYRAPVSAAAQVTQAGEEPAPKPAQRRQVQPSAPVSRDPPAGPGVPRTTRSVSLNPEQQATAKFSFPHLPPQQAFAEYAKNLIELEAEGKLGRTSH